MHTNSTNPLGNYVPLSRLGETPEQKAVRLGVPIIHPAPTPFDTTPQMPNPVVAI